MDNQADWEFCVSDEGVTPEVWMTSSDLEKEDGMRDSMAAWFDENDM